MSGATTQVGIVEWARSHRERAARSRCSSPRTLGAWVPRIAPAGGQARSWLATPATSPGTPSCGTASCRVLHDRPEGSAVVDASLTAAEAALAAVTEPKAVYEDVLPIVVAAYRSWSGESTPIAERPVMRVLDLVLHDLDFDAQEGHDLFAARLTAGPVSRSPITPCPGRLTGPVS